MKAMPESWGDDLAIAGDPDECAEKLGRLLAAGFDSGDVLPGSESKDSDDTPRLLPHVGSSTPEETAASIAAEIIQIRQGGKAERAGAGTTMLGPWDVAAGRERAR
ncbi:hypothetical protein [Streptomyces thermocarboxydovorans]